MSLLREVMSLCRKEEWGDAHPAGATYLRVPFGIDAGISGNLNDLEGSPPWSKTWLETADSHGEGAVAYRGSLVRATREPVTCVFDLKEPQDVLGWRLEIVVWVGIKRGATWFYDSPMVCMRGSLLLDSNGRPLGSMSGASGWPVRVQHPSGEIETLRIGENYAAIDTSGFSPAFGEWMELEKRRGVWPLRVFTLLNARNVVAQLSPQDQRERSRRARLGRKGKRGLEWHELAIVKPGIKKSALAPRGVRGEPLTRAHLARGHFKSFTDDAPLFGKYSGRFWWSPHVRGDKRRGVVLKDYEIRSARETADA